MHCQGAQKGFAVDRAPFQGQPRHMHSGAHISMDLWYFGPFSHGFIHTPPVELAACPIGPEVRFATPFGPEVK